MRPDCCTCKCALNRNPCHFWWAFIYLIEWPVSFQRQIPKFEVTCGTWFAAQRLVLRRPLTTVRTSLLPLPSTVKHAFSDVWAVFPPLVYFAIHAACVQLKRTLLIFIIWIKLLISFKGSVISDVKWVYIIYNQAQLFPLLVTDSR